MRLKTLLTCIILVFISINISWAQQDKTEQRIVKWVDDNNEPALQLLKDIININSGTMNFDGVRAVADVLMPKFQALGMETQWLDGSSFNRAGHLVAKIEGGKGPKIMLIGHLDTVFEPDSPNQEWRQIDENTINKTISTKKTFWKNDINLSFPNNYD